MIICSISARAVKAFKGEIKQGDEVMDADRQSSEERDGGSGVTRSPAFYPTSRSASCY